MKTLRLVLIGVFAVILLAMLAITVRASLTRSLLEVGPPLTDDPWFHATLADAYFGFLTFFIWVGYKERSWWRKLTWFVLIMTLGNIAMSVYMLLQLARWDPDQGLQAMLLRK